MTSKQHPYSQMFPESPKAKRIYHLIISISGVIGVFGISGTHIRGTHIIGNTGIMGISWGIMGIRRVVIINSHIRRDKWV